MNDEVTAIDRTKRALQDSETRLQQVLDNTSALVFAKDSQGRYLFVNREFERVTGRRSGEVLGRTDEMVFPSDLAVRFRHNDLRILTEEHAIEFEEVADFGDGPQTFLSSKFPLLDAEGRAYAVCGIATDITERRRAVEALRDSEAQYRAIFNASEDALILWDSQMRRVDVNSAYKRIYGWEREDVLGRGYDGSDAPADYAQPRQAMIRRALAGETVRAELDAVRKDGEHIRTEVVAIPFRHRGEPHVLAIARDITERKAAEQALRASEEQYRAIFNASADAMILWDSQFRRIDVNPAFEKMYGWTRDEVIGRGFDFPSFSSEHARLRRELVGRALAGESCRAEHDVVARDGTHFRAEVHAIPFRRDGEPHVLVIARDITERKRLEEALSSAALAVSEAEGEALFRELARYLAAILRVDAVFISTVDPADPAQMQVRAMHLDGKVLENFSYGLADTPCATVVGQQFRFYPSRLGELFPHDVHFRKLGFDGYAGHPLTDSSGRPVGLLAVVSRRPLENPAFVESVLRIFSVRVIAELERVAARDALLGSEAQYRAIFNASVDGLVLQDRDHRIVDVNDAYLAMYGYRREEVIGRRVAEIVPAELREHCDRWLPEILDGVPCHFEAQNLRRDGSRIEIDIHGVPMQYNGQLHALVIMRDITEAKRAQDHHAQLEARLRQAKKMEAIGQLTGGIAHDFNNLLTSILGYVTLAGERESALADPRLGGYLAQARRSCERARDLIQQMLMFSRGRRGTPHTVALAPLVEEALVGLRPVLPPRLGLAVHLTDPTPLARLDPLQFEQVLLNLCINARDAIDGDGTVGVSVRPLRANGLVCAGCRAGVDGEFVELCVEDSGHGMTPDVAERIFEPFFSTKAEGKGTGMGLAMVHGIVHEHGGHVVVESTPGRGSRFRVLWPAEAADAPVPSAAIPGSTGAARPRRPELAGSVLVVDDETTVGEFMRELLETWGLQATCAASGPAAFDLVTAAPHRFDAVITDQSMPRMTGVQLAQALRKLRGDLPVILYTGYEEGLARAELAEAGIRAVLRKPVEPAALEASLRNALQLANRGG